VGGREAGRGCVLPRGVTRRLVAEFASRAKQPRPTPELKQLTDRGGRVMGLVAAGLTNVELWLQSACS
jgi:DNA-binding NarL/FixJ family response regulator